MKKILVAVAIFAGMSMSAEGPRVPPPAPKQDSVVAQFHSKMDSLRKADSALIAEKRKEISDALKAERSKDSALFANKLPDSLRNKVAQHVKDFDAKKAEFDSVKTLDTAKMVTYKAKADSLRKTWESKRDSQITRIKDTAVRAKVQARIAEIEKHRTEVKAKVDARKAEIEAKIADLKAKIEKLKTDKPAVK